MRILTIILILVFETTLIASPKDDLGSSSQETRDEAAKELLSTFTPPPRTEWDELVSSLSSGISKENFLELLPSNWTTTGPLFATGGGYCQSFRLHDAWVLDCWFQSKDHILIDYKLTNTIRKVWVEPPPNFTGSWVTYFVNGQKSHEIEYSDGKYSGELIAYYANGSKCYIQRYSQNGIDGEEIGYYPTGKIRYRGRHRTGRQTGTWTWYDEDGSVQSTETFPGDEASTPDSDPAHQADASKPE